MQAAGTSNRYTSDINIWKWLPTLYVSESMPYVLINTLTVYMYTRLGVDIEKMALYTGLLYLPWVIKPLWSPFVDVFWHKRKWILLMEALMGVCFALVACSLSLPSFFVLSLILFWIAGFSSATHDIAADGYYMLALDPHQQAEFVGIRSTFFRLGSLFASGGLVYLAGIIENWGRANDTETPYGSIRLAWQCVFMVSGILLFIFSLYNSRVLPRVKNGGGATRLTAHELCKKLGATFVSFVTKPHFIPALAFMLLYRLPEALCIKLVGPFMLAPRAEGGLAMTTSQVGVANGVTGVIALLAGGILGGIAISRHGLKKWLWPMAMSLTLPCILYAMLAVWQPSYSGLGAWGINLAVGVEQFGYGFGFTAYMMYLMYFAKGEWETSHYAFCTAFMALGMMLPGIAAGKIFTFLSDISLFGEQAQGYVNFFGVVVVSTVFTCMACAVVNIAPGFGVKRDKEK